MGLSRHFETLQELNIRVEDEFLPLMQMILGICPQSVKCNCDLSAKCFYDGGESLVGRVQVPCFVMGAIQRNNPEALLLEAAWRVETSGPSLSQP